MKLNNKQPEKISKLLLISHCLPPLPFGPSGIFSRLFEYFKTDSYIAMTSRCNNGLRADGARLPCRHFYAGRNIFESNTRMDLIREWIDIAEMVARGLLIMKREKVDGIMVHPTSGNFLLASYILHKLTGAALYVYILDLYSSSQTYRLRKLLSRPIERIALRSAKKVFVMSEALRKFYSDKYCVEPILLPHPVKVSDSSARTAGKFKKKKNKKVIVFTGMIYEAQLDALQNLVKAVNSMSGTELHIYSQRTIPKLEELGLSGENVKLHGFVEHSKIPYIQQNADILFLPMAFNSPYPDVIKTASPGKLPEYLISGTPVLVHAPKEAYISWYARKYGWGLVVDRPDPELLSRAISDLAHNRKLADEVVSNAGRTANIHEQSRVAGIMKHHLGM